MKIAIDFVAGSHGNFLETICNHGFGFTTRENNFLPIGTSHVKSSQYKASRVFVADHYFQKNQNFLNSFNKIISIRFTQDDLLILSSVSLLRAGDYGIDNQTLEIDTVSKLNNRHYSHIISEIKNAYPSVDLTAGSVPRHVLREFYKFSFKNPEINGYWLEQEKMSYPTSCQVFNFDYSSFYNQSEFVQSICNLEKFLDLQFNFDNDFYKQYQQFLSLIPFLDNKNQCDQIIDDICNNIDKEIPPLTLFQESYINGRLEKLFNKEMPFHQDNYFVSCQDVLYYISNIAPNL